MMYLLCIANSGEVNSATSPAAPSARRYAEQNIQDLEIGPSPTGTDSTRASGIEIIHSISSVSKASLHNIEELRSHTTFEVPNDVECAICLEGYSNAPEGSPDKSVTRLVCGHIYHQDCITAWLRKDGAAPRFDSYAELGVHQHSSDKEVRAAYLKAVKQHHPDAGGNHDKFVRVQQAYEHINKEKKDGGAASTAKPNYNTSSSSSSTSSTNGNGGFGSGGFGGTTWWWSTGRPKGEDFAFDEREFEKAWSKFKRTQRRQGNNKWAQYQSDTDEEDYYDESDEERIFERRKNNSPRERRRERDSTRRAYARYTDENMNPRDRKPKTTAGRSIVDIFTAHTYHSGLLNGTYKRIGLFNGRPAYRRISGNDRWPVFLYYSERFNDWKLHSQLRDTNLCYAFLDDPDCSDAFELANSAEPWFVFNDRKHRYEILSDMKLTIPNRANAESAEPSSNDTKSVPPTEEELEAVSSWSAAELKQWLLDSDMASKAELCFEKGDLVSAVRELMALGVRPKNGTRSEEATRSDRLQSSYHAFGNRIEFAYKSGQPLEEYFMTYGDRGRVYGVFVDGQYKFSVIWDRKNGRWARANFRYETASTKQKKEGSSTKQKK
ncbi:PCI domain-containing protein 2 [Perkinsus chesapeaki]|uniref:PCI domain-containing protein 2 n=1 Tax=Perkinsus chesapeaki TaxID=330153 RepID=A0A7J6MMY3_PERCH|nr:PCI domain-containing protein 2 [Perkinsus chesapeaki]